MATELNQTSPHNKSLISNDDSPRPSEQPLLKSESPENLDAMEKKYAAFVRKDAYGIMGRGQLPIADKVLLYLAMATLVPIRVLMGMLILVVYYVICRVCTLFYAPNREEEQEDYAHMTGWRRLVVVRCGRFLSRLMLFNFGFYSIEETRLYLSEVLLSRSLFFLCLLYLMVMFDLRKKTWWL